MLFSVTQVEPVLRSSATTAEILEAMKHPITGIGFLTTQHNLPSQTFVSADAVSWLINHMEGVIAVERGIQVCSLALQRRLFWINVNFFPIDYEALA